MNTKKLRKLAYLVIVVLGVLLFAYVFSKYLFMIALPFLFGWGIAFAVRPIAHYLEKKLRIPAKFLRVLLSLLFLLGILFLAGFLVGRIALEGVRLIGELAQSGGISELFAILLNPLGAILGDSVAAGELEAKLSEAVSALLSSALSGLGGLISAVASAIPEIFLFLVVAIISSVYFSYDLEKINRAVLTHLPKRVGEMLVRFKDGFLLTAVRYLRSYLILMSITFVTMTFGFVILKVDYALAIALVVSLLDALPVIGVGTVLVPWSIVRFAVSDAPLGAGLLVLFLVNAILRQLIEPKIVGDSLGIPPVLSLVLLYVTYSVFGIAGLLLIPLFTVILRVFIKNDVEKEKSRNVESETASP